MDRLPQENPCEALLSFCSPQYSCLTDLQGCMCRLLRFLPVSAAVFGSCREPEAEATLLTRPGKGSFEGFVERKCKDKYMCIYTYKPGRLRFPGQFHYGFLGSSTADHGLPSVCESYRRPRFPAEHGWQTTVCSVSHTCMGCPCWPPECRQTKICLRLLSKQATVCFALGEKRRPWFPQGACHGMDQKISIYIYICNIGSL